MKSEVRYEVNLQANDLDRYWEAPVFFATQEEARAFLARKLSTSRYRDGFIERVEVVFLPRIGDFVTTTEHLSGGPVDRFEAVA